MDLRQWYVVIHGTKSMLTEYSIYKPAGFVSSLAASGLQFCTIVIHSSFHMSMTKRRTRLIKLSEGCMADVILAAGISLMLSSEKDVFDQSSM